MFHELISRSSALTSGDDPPRDRTGELRKLGFEGRHLKEVQMTTDTAVGVSKRVVEDKSKSDVFEGHYTDEKSPSRISLSW